MSKCHNSCEPDYIYKSSAESELSDLKIEPSQQQPSENEAEETSQQQPSENEAEETSQQQPEISSSLSSFSNLFHQVNSTISQIIDALDIAKSESFRCKYCNIVFNEYSLYSIHVGMHSNSNPWKCNVCGHICSNKIDFAVHILHLSNTSYRFVS